MVHFVQNKVVWPDAKNIGMLFQDKMLRHQCRHLWVDGCSNLLKIMQDYFRKIFIVPLSLVMLHYEILSGLQILYSLYLNIPLIISQSSLQCRT